MNLLIVEDDASIAELERTYLEFYGYVCDIAGDSDTALSMFAQKEYILAVIDVMLPGSVDGFGLCRKIREISDIPLLIVSARTGDDDKITGLGLGADDYITKPFNGGELVARVKAHISRYRRLTGSAAEEETASKELRVKDIVIDTENHRVTVSGKEVRFTEKEYHLLLFFCENPDRTFSKEHLFDRVWDMDSFGDISTVTVHVKKIRDKLEKNGGCRPYIDTVWGVGYRFLP